MIWGFASATAVTLGLVAQVGGPDADTQAARSFDIAETRSVHIKGVDGLRLVVGKAASLTISERRNRFDKIRIESTAKRLVIEADDKGWFSPRDYTVTLTLTALDALSLAGSTDGNIRGIQSDQFTLDAAGSMDLSLQGQCGVLTMDVAGSVDMDAKDLVCVDVEIAAAGAVDLIVHATNSLDVGAAGASDVRYAGSPAAVSSSFAGAGSLEPVSIAGKDAVRGL